MKSALTGSDVIVVFGIEKSRRDALPIRVLFRDLRRDAVHGFLSPIDGDTCVAVLGIVLHPVAPYPIKEVSVFYGYDRDPRIRYLHSATVEKNGSTYLASCPIATLDEPLFVFANVTYDTGKVLPPRPGLEPTTLVTVTSDMRAAYPHQLSEARVKTTVERTTLLDDFAQGWQNWSQVAANNSHHWTFTSYAVNDPSRFGPRNGKLAFEITTDAANNQLAVILEADKWRGYSGRKNTRYLALVSLAEAGNHEISLGLADFQNEDGKVLDHYDFLTNIELMPGKKAAPNKVADQWNGSVPTFANLRWEGGTLEPRITPYLRDPSQQLDADAAFEKAFQEGIDKSVELEKLDGQ